MNKSFHIKSILALGFTFLLSFVCGISFAQPPQKESRQDREKIQQLKIAHLTLALDMTDEQAQAFWPVYNKYDKLIETERKSRPSLDNIENISDVEAAQILDQMHRHIENVHSHRVSMHQELSQIISPKQLLTFYKAEQTFKKRLVERLRGPRGPRGGAGERIPEGNRE